MRLKSFVRELYVSCGSVWILPHDLGMMAGRTSGERDKTLEIATAVGKLTPPAVRGTHNITR